MIGYHQTARLQASNHHTGLTGAGINIKEAVTAISIDTEKDQKTLRTWSQN